MKNLDDGIDWIVKFLFWLAVVLVGSLVIARLLGYF